MGNCFGSNNSVHNANSGPSNAGTSPAVTNNPLQLKSSPPKSTKVSNPGSGDVPQQPADASGGTLHAFTYADLRTATRNFRPDSLLGEGGFGSVFKGYIDEQTYMPARPHQGMVIAVKRLNPEGHQGHKEWMAEVYFLGAVHHPNLVKLIGFCAEDDHRLLVYEFMPRGSLENHLFRKGTHNHTLSWAVRMKIAIGAARGLTFLHDTERPVIFRDFKSSNVLLDSNYNAKLSDFGLARDGPTGDNTHVSTRVIGTYGYAAPEYVATGHLTSKSDVYSFGVVLLEILTGRRAVDKNRPEGEQNLVEWANPYLTDKRRFLRIIDQKLEGQYSLKGAQRIAQVAHNCLFQEPKTRPSMREILESLEPLLNTRELSKYTLSPAKGESGSDVDAKNDVHRNGILKSNLSHASPKNSLDGQHQSPKVGGFVERRHS